MIIEQALHDQLAATTAVTDIVSTRIYPEMLPENPTLPAITYQRTSGARTQVMSAASGLAAPHFQVDAWAATYAAVKALATQVRKALDGYTGTLGGTGGVAADIMLLNDIDLLDPETGWHRVVMDFEIWHPEA